MSGCSISCTRLPKCAPQRVAQIPLHAEQQAVYGRELERRVMDVLHLDQRPAGRVSGPGAAGLEPFPAGLGGGQRVVAVAHRELHGRCTGGQAMARGKSRPVGQRVQRLQGLRLQRRVGRPAGDAAHR
jgi:hypothetical protein